MELLATVAFVLGLVILARSLIKGATERSTNETEQRLTDLLAEEMSGADVVMGATDPKAAKAKRSNSPTADWLARKLHGSKLFSEGEGKSFMEMLDEELVLAGLRPQMTPYQALATALLIWAFGVVVPTMLMVTIGLPKGLYGAIVLVFSMYPIMKLRRLKLDRQDALKTELPVFIQQLRMMVSSGENLDQAIAKVVRNTELDPYDSHLAREFGQALAEYTMGGKDRDEALRGISKRTQVPSVEALVEAIIQGYRHGTDMSTVLSEYGVRAREMWRQDRRTYKARKEPLITLGLVITMCGGFILVATPMMINLLRTMSNF